MPENFSPLTVSELLERTVRLTGRIFVPGAAIAAAAMLPAGLAAGFALRELIAAINDSLLLAAHGAAGINAALPVAYAAAECAAGAAIFFFAASVLNAAAIDLAAACIRSEQRSWQSEFSRVWRPAFSIFVQTILKWLVLGGIVSLPAMLVSKITNGLEGLAFGAGAAAAVWLYISWATGAQAIVCERYSAVGGLYRSFAVVRRFWWRTLWILMLFAIMLQFILSILTTPLYGFSLYPALQRLIEAPPPASDFARSYGALLPALISAAWAFGMLAAVSASLAAIVRAAYKTLLFYDLRARHGEFTLPPSDQIPQPVMH